MLDRLKKLDTTDFLVASRVHAALAYGCPASMSGREL
jgi:hypothetical protein